MPASEEGQLSPAPAAAYLSAALARGNRGEFLKALRGVAESFGGMHKLAQRSGLNATQLYRTLSPRGNPSLKSLQAVLKAIGMKLAVQPLSGASRGEER
jgi:probable addiction module antidote protein